MKKTTIFHKALLPHFFRCFNFSLGLKWNVYTASMEGVDIYLAVIRPKPFHKPPKNEFQANFYDILLLEISHSESRPLKGLPKVSVPYQEDPRVKVVDFLFFLTGADRGGLQGEYRAWVLTNTSPFSLFRYYLQIH